MHKIYVHLLLLFFSSQLIAQNREGYNLLWKIEKENSTKQGYLFGTAHIKNDVAFDFSDSVLVAFEKCDILAVEVSLDDYLKLYSKNRKKDNGKEINPLKNELSKEDYDKLKLKVKSDLDFNLEDLKSISPLIIRRLFSERYNQSDDNLLTLDNYLYDVAKGQGMEVVGLEDPDFGIRGPHGFNSDLEKEIFVKEFIEDENPVKRNKRNIKQELLAYDRFLETYYQGNVDSLYNMYYASVKGFDDPYDVAERNELMVNRLDSLFESGNIFAAVGAAHLAGEKGMITLLREKGYKLSPVQASFSDLVDDYKSKFKETAGYTLGSIPQGYRIRLKGKPAETPIPNSNLKMYLYTDLKTDKVNLVMSVESPDVTLDDELIIDAMIENVAARTNGTVEGKKEINHNGRRGFRVTVNAAGASNLMYIFRLKSRVYVFGEVNPYRKHTRSEERKFLKTIELFDFTRESSDWGEVENETHAFKAWLPSNYQFIEREFPMEYGEEGSLKLTVYSALTPDQSSFIFYVYSYSPGYAIEADTTMYDILEEVVYEQYRVEKVSDKPIVMGPYTGRGMVFSNSGNLIKMNLIVRGNKTYALVTQGSDTSSTNSVNFFNNFSFLPLEDKIEFKDYSSPNERFQLRLPNDDNTYDKEEYLLMTGVDSVETYSFMDEGHHIYTNVLEYHFGEYSYFKDMEALKDYFYDDTSNYASWSDTMVTDGQFPYYEIVYKEKGVSYFNRERIIPSGSIIYQLQVLVGNELEPDAVDEIFNSFKPLITGKFDLKSKKTSKLIEAIYSSDSTTAANARSALWGYEFDSTEIELIYKVVSNPGDLDTAWRSSIISSFIGSFSDVNDERTQAFLTTYYDSCSETSIKSGILRVLGELATIDSADFYLSRLLNAGEGYHYPGFFYDSVVNVKTHMSTIVKALSNENVSNNMIMVLNFYMVNDSAFINFLGDYKDDLKQHYLNLLGKQVLDSINYSNGYEISTTLHLLSQLGGLPSEQSATAELLKIDFYDLKAAAAAELIGLGAKVKRKAIKKLLEQKDEALSFVSYLQALNKEDILNDFLDQRELVELFIFSELAYEGYYGQDVELVELVETNIKGEDVRVYFFTFKDDHDEGSWLAASGMQPQDGSLNFTQDYTDIWLGEYKPSEFEAVKADILNNVLPGLE